MTLEQNIPPVTAWPLNIFFATIRAVLLKTNTDSKFIFDFSFWPEIQYHNYVAITDCWPVESIPSPVI